jgi:DNA-binding XRE family transcriptional regulator
MYKPEDKDKFIELRIEGHSFDDIAKQLNISKQTLVNWSKEEAVQIQLMNLEELRKEELHKKYIVTSKSRIEMLGLRLNKLLEELDKRDFKDLSTDSLIKLVLLTSSKLKEEYTPIYQYEYLSLSDSLMSFAEKKLEKKEIY